MDTQLAPLALWLRHRYLTGVGWFCGTGRGGGGGLPLHQIGLSPPSQQCLTQGLVSWVGVMTVVELKCPLPFFASSGRGGAVSLLSLSATGPQHALPEGTRRLGLLVPICSASIWLCGLGQVIVLSGPQASSGAFRGWEEPRKVESKMAVSSAWPPAATQGRPAKRCQIFSFQEKLEIHFYVKLPV